MGNYTTIGRETKVAEGNSSKLHFSNSQQITRYYNWKLPNVTANYYLTTKNYIALIVKN